MDYLDFELLILPVGQGASSARIIDSPGGQASVTFTLPFDAVEVEDILARLRTPRRSRAEVEAARRFGGKLFEAIFEAEMRGCLRASLDEANRQGKGLRMRLRFADEAIGLGELPWELLYYAAQDRFFVLSPETPLVRYLELPESIEPLPVKPPLGLLVLIASPTDAPPLNVEREWEVLNEALAPLEAAGKVRIERPEQATATALQRALRRDTFHIVHFIGHGGFDERSGEGLLLLEGEDSTGRLVTGRDLGILLRGYDAPRLIVLNACEGARFERANPYGGAAQSLVRHGIPAAVAMQFKISDTAAITLAREFYSALADGWPVDAALAEGRRAVYLLGDTLEWATPVLHLRAPDGRLFDVGKEEAAMASEREKKPDEESPSIRINVEGDQVGGDKVVHGDEVHGDKISVGDISGSTVAIGRGASARVEHSQIIYPFEVARKKLDELPIPEPSKQEAKQALQQLEDEGKADEPDVDRLDRWLAVLEDIAPDVVEVLVDAITNPGAAVAAGLRVAIRMWRKARGAARGAAGGG